MMSRIAFNPTRSSSAAIATAVSLLAFAPTTASAQAPPVKPAEKCLSDLRSFDDLLQKDGYWFHGSGFGYGYPMYGYGYANGGDRMPVAGKPMSTGYWRARPGYEVRTLMASANIMAQRGDQAACETLLTSTRAIYTDYAAELRKDKVAHVDSSDWRHRQIAAAVSVSGSDSAFRSDQLVGAGVVNPQGDNLGTIDDIVMSPQDGKIAFLVIGRGGVFGIGKKYVPVPWDDFKVAPDAELLVLDTQKASMDAAPEVMDDHFSVHGDFGAQSQKVSAYWGAHLSKN